MINHIDDLRVGCVLLYRKSSAFEVTAIDDEGVHEKHIWDGTGDLLPPTSAYSSVSWKRWIKEEIVYEPGEWKMPGDAFEKHRERMAAV